MAFCHAVAQGQQGWSSCGLVQPTSEWKETQILHEFACAPAPPKTSFGCRKGGAFLHGSTPCWCRQTCEPSEWVTEEYVCASMHDVWVRAPFRTVSPETRALSREEHGRFSAHASRLAYVQSMSSQDRRVYAASAPSHWMARVLLAVRTSSRMQEIK